MKITAEISNQVIKLLSNQVQSQREVTELLNAVKTRLKLGRHKPRHKQHKTVNNLHLTGLKRFNFFYLV